MVGRAGLEPATILPTENTFTHLLDLFRQHSSEPSRGTKSMVLPADLRLKLYDETFQLRREKRWGYRRIARALSESHGVHVPKGTVSNWILGTYKPSRRLHRYFAPVSSPHLAYVIGAVLGDGYTTKDRGRSIVGFTNNDLDLLNHFRLELSKVLGTTSAGRITSGTPYGAMKVTVACTLLALFLQKPLQLLGSYIEKHPTDFIRGFLDSEGSAAITLSRGRLRAYVTASNSNVEILEYISSLLRKRFYVKSTIVLGRKPGLTYIRGQPVVFKKPVFRLCINGFHDVKRYPRLIGFTSRRKRTDLQEGIDLIRQHGSSVAAKYWLRSHHKVGYRWVRTE